jgi:AbrB family looped-hinge helix DNA binding protein
MEAQMRQFTATITERGQMTVPAEVRRALGLGAHSKVTITLYDGKASLEPAKFTLETVYGSVQPINRPEDFKELSRRARDEHAREVVREMQEP